MRKSHVVAAAALAAASYAWAASYDAKLFGEMRWRSIGPYRGGRTKATAGVGSQPNVFYIGVCNGGVWKTTDYGRTWNPIFDAQPTGSIGAVAVAPSDPNVVYVGSGEGLQRPDLSIGDGIYKSTDAGKTWTHLGLARRPADSANRHRPAQSGPAVRRGARSSVRSQRGARHFPLDRRRTDLREGALQGREHGRERRGDRPFESATSSMRALWEARQGPWENGAWSGTNGGIFKSTDGGDDLASVDQGSCRKKGHAEPDRHCAQPSEDAFTPR